MNKIIALIALIIVCVFIYAKESLDSNTQQKEHQINDCIQELDAYSSYYMAVETLLDSIPVDVDSPILETDAGSDYLATKARLDSIRAINHKFDYIEHGNTD